MLRLQVFCKLFLLLFDLTLLVQVTLVSLLEVVGFSFHLLDLVGILLDLGFFLRRQSLEVWLFLVLSVRGCGGHALGDVECRH